MTWLTIPINLLLCIVNFAWCNFERHTTSGKILGFLDNNVEKNFGIPYAAPPVGELRWKPPQPHSAWRETRNATYMRSICPQGGFFIEGIAGNEDCLFLNIYVPRTPIVGAFAVMVWIHGGGFILGSSDVYDSSLLAGNNDVIVVTINYRLGILGFLSTGDSAATGNYGLLDQRAALQWVHENIESFGGDKNRVTIFGESAGSATVLYQAISPMNLGQPKLFHRVIAQSGTPLSWWAFQSHPRHHALELFKNVGCPTNSSSNAVDCLRNIPFSELIPLQQQRLSFWGEVWTPSVDGRFVTDIPDIMVSSEELKTELNGRYEFLIGANEYDVNLYSRKEMETIQDEESFKTFLRDKIKIYFRDSKRVEQAIFAKYVEQNDARPKSPMEWQRLALNVNRDYIVLSSSVNMSRIASSENGFNSTSYLYFYIQEPDKVVQKVGLPRPLGNLTDGAIHGDELSYLFGWLLFLPGATDEYKKLSHQIMRYWTNFAKTGNPSPEENPDAWPKFNWKTQKYMIIGKDKPDDNLTRVADHLETDKVIFWTEQLELYGQEKGLDDSVGWNFIM